MAARKKSKRTSFVPRLVLGTAVAGVIPFCALTSGCGSEAGSNDDDAGIGPQGVACPAFQCGQGVAAIGFDSGARDGSKDARSDGPTVDAQAPPGVAAIGFDAAAHDGATDGGANDGAHDA